MKRGLRVQYLYHDNDILEVEVSAFNGRFAGVTALYVSRDELSQGALAMQGFPNAQSDERELTWGSFGSESAGGAVRLQIRCIDSALHVRASIQIGNSDGTESAIVIAGLEPAAIDSFLPQLQQIEQRLSGEATLEFSG